VTGNGANTTLPLSVRFAQRALQQDAVPALVVERAQLLLADFVACTVRGATLPSSRSAAKALLALAPIHAGKALRAEDALGMEAMAFLGGINAHGLELDDTYEPASLHAGTVVWPTVLALAAQGNQSCDVVLRAAVAGYDAMCTLGVMAGAKELYERGFHPTGVCGVVGSAVAAGIMLGLDESQLVSAIGIAASYAGGTLAFLDDGGWTKRLHAGAAAAHGMRAAALARHGFRGPERSLDGRFGMLWTFAGVGAERAAVPFAPTGTGIRESGVKLYPCCRYIHGTLDLLLALRAEEGFDVSEVEHVECGVLSAGFALVAAPAADKIAVRNEVGAQFSLPYAAALALTYGEATLDGFQRAAEFASALHPLMERVECVVSPALDRAFPEEWGAAVRVELTNGRRLERSTRHMQGSPAAPVGWDELERKMTGLVGAVQAAGLVNECQAFAGAGAARDRIPVQFARRAALRAAGHMEEIEAH
jgi:2-methylcitrate dehydratase PrpD